MKRIFAVLLLVGFCSFVLTGCGESSIVGTWKTESGYDDLVYTDTVTFNEDGTGVLTHADSTALDDRTYTLTWTQADGDNYYIEINNRSSFLVEIKGRKFTVGEHQGLYMDNGENGKDAVYEKQ